MAEGMVKDFRMWWGNFDWVCASLDCLSVFGLELRGPYGAVGLSSHWSGWARVVETCKRSYYCCKVLGGHIKVIPWVWHVLLHRNHCIVLQSHDLFSFQNEHVVSVQGMCGGGMGHI